MTRLTGAVGRISHSLLRRRPTTTAGLATIVLVAVAAEAGVELSEQAAGAIVAAVILLVGSLTPRDPCPVAEPANDDSPVLDRRADA